MRERAAKVWAEISRPEFYCGYADPFTRGLATAATDDLADRSTALQRALALDPFRDDTCPTTAAIDAEATAAAAIEACGLADPGTGWQDDVDASSYLAMRAVRLRLEALRLNSGDRALLLDTLVLATALVREK